MNVLGDIRFAFILSLILDGFFCVSIIVEQL